MADAFLDLQGLVLEAQLQIAQRALGAAAPMFEPLQRLDKWPAPDRGDAMAGARGGFGVGNSSYRLR